jgi:secreted trypsin-like serine protease
MLKVPQQPQEQQLSSKHTSIPSNHRRRHLIIQGTDAALGAFPYFAYIQWGGGALIAPDMVLTAGHCLPDDLDILRTMTVQVGKYNRQDDDHENDEGADEGATDEHKNGKDSNEHDDDTHHHRRLQSPTRSSLASSRSSSVETFTVTRAIQHPDFHMVEHGRGENVFEHDFLLLKLSGRSNAPFVSINRDSTLPHPGDSLTVAGLGWIQPDYRDDDTWLYPQRLQQVNLEYLPNDQCSLAQARKMTYHDQIQDWHLCTTGGRHNERDACNYDSGGPIVRIDNATNQHVLVGSVSWGEECGDPDFPGVNSRTSQASDWIDAVVCEFSDYPPEEFQCANRRPFAGGHDDGGEDHPPTTNYDGHRHKHADHAASGQYHVLTMLSVLALVTAAAALILYKRHKRSKGVYQQLSRHVSSRSYDSINSTGVEIIT